MDRAAIFTEVLRRNAFRREARLPALHVWSRALMVHSSPWNGRMRYGPSSAWERPHDGGSASRDPASSREPEGVGPAPRDQPEDGRQVEEAPLGPGRTHRP